MLKSCQIHNITSICIPQILPLLLILIIGAISPRHLDAYNVLYPTCLRQYYNYTQITLLLLCSNMLAIIPKCVNEPGLASLAINFFSYIF